MFVGLGELASDEPVVPKHVMDALLSVRVENLTDRKTGPFVRWLEHSDGKISQDVLILLLQGSLPGDRTSKAHSDIMISAMHKYIGQHQLHLKYPDVWASINRDLDDFITTLWAKAAVTDDERQTWLVAHRHAASTLLDVEDAVAALKEDSKRC